MSSDTKQKIIEAASLAMVAKSYNGCGLNEILKEAGVPKGSFYHFFKSKEELGIAVVENSSDAAVQMLRQRLSDRSLSPVERLRGYYLWAREHLTSVGFRRECLIPKLALEIGALSPPMRAAVRCGWDQWRSIIAQCVREGQEAGEIDPNQDAEKLSDFMISAFEGVLIRAQVNNDVKPIDEFLHFVFEVLIPKRT
ncbi:TetR/AcrR family transcriptional regulator [Blastopirellula sp. JC732]|uniref:TetR/AcrR family transcriptional regulator n=1 Tax=Blastopirellula sediminis TaxID=2894196 RepID=A0A9X1MIP8_9BACT|nr:TetR/AcrR family transcriptional regulator [Blastopirellula sediminis]MCC9607906.1 TetR/AcrR family transcriptional regulator [Blastopirellula sediminis]MCC9627301.1 TetR/AcrR family transcriptional regulator [Blastopirellula sediminis]